MKIPPLRKTYKDQLVLDLPELILPDDQIIAVCGQNGSGKTTFGKILAGIIEADNCKNPFEDFSVGYMMQRSLAFKMSVKRNLMLNADPSAEKSENQRRAQELLEALGLSSIAGKNAQKLSGGQIQRMSLARSLMKPYDILILDEPTASMDQETIPAAESLVREYHEKNPGTIFLISHSPEQVQRLTSRILLLEKGKLRSALLPE